jgi:hypothetical protein
LGSRLNARLIASNSPFFMSRGMTAHFRPS